MDFRRKQPKRPKRPLPKIDRAIEALGLQYPVKIKWLDNKAMNRQANLALSKMKGDDVTHSGCHRWLHNGVHEITLNYESPFLGPTILGHELIHCQQAERTGSRKAWEIFSQTNARTYEYWDDPIEIEARNRSYEIAPLIEWPQ